MKNYLPEVINAKYTLIPSYWTSLYGIEIQETTITCISVVTSFSIIQNFGACSIQIPLELSTNYINYFRILQAQTTLIDQLDTYRYHEDIFESKRLI